MKTEESLRIDEERADHLGEKFLKRTDSDSQHKYDELGAYMAQLRQYKPLRDQSACNRLFDWYHNGDSEKRREARDLIVYGNIRLVLSIALRRMGRGLPLLDMMQEGVIGLMTAIEKFEPERGFRFSTYATHCVKHAIGRAIADIGYSTHRFPVHMIEKMTMVRKAFTILTQRHGQFPTELEIFEFIKAMDTKAAEAMRMREVVKCLTYINEGIVELDASVSDEDGVGTYGEIFVGDFPKTETIVEARRLLVEYQTALVRIEETISQFPPRDATVLRLRFGLGDFEAMTLEEVGERYSLTRERIRQIEAKALKELETQLDITPKQLTDIIDVIEELAKIVTSV